MTRGQLWGCLWCIVGTLLILGGLSACGDYLAAYDLSDLYQQRGIFLFGFGIFAAVMGTRMLRKQP